MIERTEFPSIREKQRLQRFLTSSQDPDKRKRRITLYRVDDEETQRRFSLSQLNPDTGSILLDPNGELYILTWHEAKIGPEYLNFTPTQSGRDLFSNPLRSKRTIRLVPHRFPLGIDVTLRAVEKVRDKYRLDGDGIGAEALQMVAGLAKLREVLLARVGFTDLTPQNLLDMIEENREFLESIGLRSPRNPEKIRIEHNLSEGFLDKNGNKSPIAAMSRTFGLEYQIRKRLEGTFPPILAKFAAITEALAFERDYTRLKVQTAVDDLDEMLAGSLFSERPTYTVWKLLGLGGSLLRNIRVRPYLAKARRTDNYLRVNAVGFVRNGDFDGAAVVMERVRNMLTKVLDTYEDYKTVKEGYHKKHPQRKKVA